MTSSDNKKLLAALEANWQAEMEGHYTYTAFAKGEVDPQRRNALRGLAAAEKHHADLWARRIRELGALRRTSTPVRRRLVGPGRLVGKSSGWADLALRRLEIDEGRDIAKYGKQLKALGDQPSIAILEEVIADEREHYQTLGNLIRSRRPLPAMPPEQAQEALDDLIAARDKGHAQAAGWVGDPVYGVKAHNHRQGQHHYHRRRRRGQQDQRLRERGRVLYGCDTWYGLVRCIHSKQSVEKMT